MWRRNLTLAVLAATMAIPIWVVTASPAAASGTSFYQYQDCATVGNEFPAAKGSVGNCIPIGSVLGTAGAFVAPGGTITLDFPGQLPCGGVGTSCGSGGEIGIGEITPPPASIIGGGFFATIVSGCSYGDTSCTIQVPSTGTPIPPDAAKLQLQACLQGVSGGTCGSAGGEIAFDYFFVGTGPPPTAAFTDEGDSTPAFNGLGEDFDASSSSSTAGPIVSDAWDFGDGTQGSGVTPEHTYAAAGTYAVTLTVTDSQGNSSTVVHNVTVPNLVITTVSLPDGAVGSTYGTSPGFALDAAGGTPPYQWALTGGTTLPLGLALSPGGVISGTPTQGGKTTVTIQVTDSSPTPLQATKSLTITVTNDLVVNSTGDLADNKPGDGVCDTGNTVANGDPECTLRAAIQEANADGGGTVTFDLPNPSTITIESSFLPALGPGVTITGPGESALTLGVSQDLGVVEVPQALELSGADDVVSGLTVSWGYGLRIEGSGSDTVSNVALVMTDEPVGACDVTDPSQSAGGFVVTAPNNQLGPGITSSELGCDIVLGAGSTGTTVTGDTLGVTDPSTGTNSSSIIVDSSGNTIGTPASPVSAGLLYVVGSNNTVQGSSFQNVSLFGSSDALGGLGSGQGDQVLGGSVQVIGNSNELLGDTIDGNFDEVPASASAVRVQPPASGTSIIDSTITDPSGSGVVIEPATSGTQLQQDTIDANGADGVRVNPAAQGQTDSEGNTFSENSISGDAGIGIDLGAGGVTQNSGDPLVANAGPNHLQNYPTFTKLSAPQSGQVEVEGGLQSVGGQTYDVEVFANSACNASGFGEGQTFLGSVTVQTGTVTGQGDFDQTFTLPAGAGTFITATATDPTGDTSEFSKCEPVGYSNHFQTASGTGGAGSPAGVATTTGSTVNFSASGFTPGETVQATLHSTPVDLGEFTADGNGDVAGGVTVPISTTVGFHDLILDGETSGVTADLPLSILAATSSPPLFTADSPPLTATVESAYTYTFAASGNPAPSFALGARAPAWLSISSTSGTVSGTPPAGTTSVAYTVTATNGVSPDATAGPFTVTVSPVPNAPSFTAETPPVTATAASAYTYTFAATGTPTPTFALLAGGPSWLSIGATSGVVSGTPPAGTTTFAYSVTATNGISPDATAGPFTVTVSSSTGAARADIDLDASAHDVKPGDTVTLHLTISGRHHKPKPTGTVSFTDNGTAVPACAGQVLPASGKVTCKLSYSSAASSPHHIVASYSGDPTYEPGTATTTIRVTKIGTRLRLDASKDAVPVGQQLTYRATIIADQDKGSPAPTGTVTFTDDGVAIPGCSNVTLHAGGPTTCTVGATKSTHRIKAVYSGDDAYDGSSATLTEVVKPAVAK